MRPYDENDRYTVKNEAYTGAGKLINSNFLNGLDAPEKSILATIKILEDRNLGKNKLTLD